MVSFDRSLVRENCVCAQLACSSESSGGLVGKKEPNLRVLSDFRARFLLRIPFPPGVGPEAEPPFYFYSSAPSARRRAACRKTPWRGKAAHSVPLKPTLRTLSKRRYASAENHSRIWLLASQELEVRSALRSSTICLGRAVSGSDTNSQ